MEGVDPKDGARRRYRALLASIVVVAVVTRVLFVLALSDVFFYGEELEKGAAAKAMLDGIGLPHHALAYHYYEGGGFVVSHLKALAFLLVGPNLLANKLVAMLTFLATLFAGTYAARRAAGDRAALVFAALYVLGPEAYQRIGMISLGIHFEACFYVMLVLGLSVRVAVDRDDRVRTWFLLGVATGLGIHFSYQLVVLAGAMLVAIAVLRGPRALFRRAPIGLAGTAVGATPLIVMWSLVGPDVFDIHGRELLRTWLINPRLAFFLRSVYLDGAFGSAFEAWCWTIASVAALALLVRWRWSGVSRLRDLAIVFGTYLGAWTLAFVFGDFVPNNDINFWQANRLAPAWMVGALMVSVVASRASASSLRGRRVAGASVVGLLLVVGASGTASTLATGRLDRIGRNVDILLESKGYVYSQYFAKIDGHVEGTDEDRMRTFLRFDEPALRSLRTEIAATLITHSRGKFDRGLRNLRELVLDVDPEGIADYELGLGTLLMNVYQHDLAAALERAEAEPDPTRSRLVEAIGRKMRGTHPNTDEVRGEVAEGLALDAPQRYFRGLGYRFAWLNEARLDPDFADAFVESLDPSVQPAFRRGFDEAVRDQRLDTVFGADDDVDADERTDGPGGSDVR
ncbi:MAG: glycosyltransferase family 39 protein [Planctomycetota bacterium]